MARLCTARVLAPPWIEMSTHLRGPRSASTVTFMRLTSSVTSLSWIPSEAVTGINKAMFESGFTHYDDPPPDVIDDLAEMQSNDRFRFANVLEAWIDVDDTGAIVDCGYGPTSGAVMGSTTIRIRQRDLATFAAPALPDIQRVPEVLDGCVRFVQTVGGHTAFPAPRRVSRPPFVQWRAPLVWTTLALTLYADGRRDFELVGASTFPRHWVFDSNRRLAAKAGLADFKEWWRKSFGKHTPWGDQESEAFVTAVETALERSLSASIMRGGEKPEIRTVKAGKALVSQGDEGREVFLVLDGVVAIECDGVSLGEVGPGAVLGERAILEGGRRTATLLARTKLRVAVARGDQIDERALVELSGGHRREEQTDH